MKVFYKRLTTKSGGEQDVLYVPGRCVMTHNLDLDTYLYSPKGDWLRKYGRAMREIYDEVEADEAVVDRMVEIGEIYIDPRDRIHNIDNQEFREMFDSLVPGVRRGQNNP